ncbi:hypothetical protein AALO_G00178710 [Alosa alosa]|uniref:Uncharacterized protein n=1 Tax=Alosa alosa TaxID=278164 RepID=A0AAV6GCW8_9TELE|nr:hypothetical protein AALO_G00178710 [Alosa alosa]
MSTSTQGRRKHNACLFRLRENCPLRRLRKNKSHDEHTHLPTPIGRHWTGQPSVLPTNDGTISVICEQQLSTAHSSCGTHRQEGNLDSMDTDPVGQAGPSFLGPPADPCSAMGHAAVSNACDCLRNPSEGSSDVSMELDSGVDPETGERAMG